MNDRFEEVAVTDYKEGNSYEGYFKLNNSGEYDGMTYMLNFKDEIDNNERFGQLQQAITNTQNTTNLDYFFISCISKMTFD